MSENSTSIVRNLKRINLISGKGGVGRTTLAATFAKAAAAAGKKTLLAEIEDDSGWDSPLARSFGRKNFTAEPTVIAKNLEAMVLSAPVGQEQFLNMFLKISSLTHLIMSNQGVKWFLDGAPAFKEMGYFYHLLLQMRKNYEVIVLDLPATGHLIGLARLPNLLLKMIPFGPIAERLKEGQKYMYDEKQSAAWIVTLPQTLPVSEAIELKKALSAEKVPIGGFILNRDPLNPFTPEEEKSLFGNPEFERLRRAHDAKKRLNEEFPQHVWLAPETLNPIEDPQFGLKITNHEAH
jgi:arsenite-transporting ATPase